HRGARLRRRGRAPVLVLGVTSRRLVDRRGGRRPGWQYRGEGWGGEFGADLVGVGVVEVVEDGEGLLPGVVGGVVVAGGVVGVAEVGVGVGFVGTGADVSVQGAG